MVYGSNADNNLTVGAKELFWVQLFSYVRLSIDRCTATYV